MKEMTSFRRENWTSVGTPVLENEEAMVIYSEEKDRYYAVEKKTKGYGYGISPYYHNFVTGDFKRCKKFFEKYSASTMAALRG